MALQHGLNLDTGACIGGSLDVALRQGSFLWPGIQEGQGPGALSIRAAMGGGMRTSVLKGT